MYGGDEVSAIVIDLGSHTCKAGYAGEDAPKAVFPSVVGTIELMDVDDGADNEKNPAIDSKTNVKDSDKGKGKRKIHVGSQSLGFRRDNMEVLSPIKDGIVLDWDVVDGIWDHALRECLLVDPKEHPMLLAEPSYNTQQQRERTAELMFEKYSVPALFLAKNAVLTSFASGRATSLVVDSGGGSTTVTPVHDGYVLQKAVSISPIGGEILTDCLLKSLESKGFVIRPRYAFKRKEIRPGEFQAVDLDFPNTTESYRLYSQRVIASDIKECVCRAPDTPYDESSYSNIPTTAYELPDGQTIEIGADRFKIPDVLFNPSLIQTIPGMENFAEITHNMRGLPQMVIDSINKSDVDIRRELYSSILLSGGTASMQQLKERLEKDLLEESPQAARVKVLASGNATERRFRSGIPVLYTESSYSNIPTTAYELPDGQTIEIGADRFKIPDVLFNPSLIQTIPGMENFAEITHNMRGLPQMVIDSINKSDVDIRRELYSSILLSGGTASMQQLKERLEKDLLEESPQAARVKVLASGNATERRFSVWRREYTSFSWFIPANVVLQI